MNLLTILTFILSSSLYSGTFIGVITDNSNGTPVIDANIIYTDGISRGATTNEKGLFSIQTNSDSIEILVKAIGYKDYTQFVFLDQVDPVNIKLQKKTIKLSPVEVLAGRNSLIGVTKNFFRLNGSSSLISRAEVIEFNDTDINRVISQVPGVYTQEEDGYGLRPNIGMRGSGLERSAKINMMEDGILIAPAPYSSPAAYYSPTAGRMESFEIRKGSSQVKYGPHSTGGAINYVSASIPDNLKFQGNISGGQFGNKFGKFKTGVSNKNYGIMFQTVLDGSDGFKTIKGGGNTGFTKNDYLFKARVNSTNELAAAELKVSQTNEISNETYLGLTREDFDVDPYSRYRASHKDKMTANHAQISLTGAVKLFTNSDLTTTLYQNKFHRNWYKLNKIAGQSISSILAEGNNGENYNLLSTLNSEDDIYDIKANNRDYLSTGIQSIIRSDFDIFGTSNDFMLGFRMHYDEMDRFQWVDLYKMDNNNLFITTAGTQGEGSKNNRLYTASAKSIFIENEVKISKMILTAGGRFESINLERKDWGEDINRDSTAGSIKQAELDVFVPGAGFSYLIRDGLNIFGGVHAGFSPPGPGIDDDDDILPEKSVNYEIGTRYNQGLNSAEILFFYNDYENLLGEDTESTGSGTYAQFNGGEVQIKGIELSLEKVFRSKKLIFPVSFSYTYTDAKFLNSFDSDFDPWGNVTKNDELPYIPRNMYHLRSGIEFNKFKFISRYKYVSRTRTKAGQGDYDRLYSTDNIKVMDLSLKYSINSNFMVESKILNLFNDKSIVASRPAGVRPNMPRTFSIGFLFDF